MKRLFFALWPDDQIRSQLIDISQQLIAPTVKIVKPYNLHCTLSFLGNVDAETEKRLRTYCDDIVSEPFSLTFERLTFWKKPRILCLLAEPVSGIMNLVSQINDRAQMAGIRTESRPYRPHVTLARKASDNIKLSFEPIDWPAQDYCLAASISTETGVQYQVLQRWPLAAHLGRRQ